MKILRLNREVEIIESHILTSQIAGVIYRCGDGYAFWLETRLGGYPVHHQTQPSNLNMARKSMNGKAKELQWTIKNVS